SQTRSWTHLLRCAISTVLRLPSPQRSPRSRRTVSARKCDHTSRCRLTAVLVRGCKPHRSLLAGTGLSFQRGGTRAGHFSLTLNPLRPRRCGGSGSLQEPNICISMQRSDLLCFRHFRFHVSLKIEYTFLDARTSLWRYEDGAI